MRIINDSAARMRKPEGMVVVVVGQEMISKGLNLRKMEFTSMFLRRVNPFETGYFF